MSDKTATEEQCMQFWVGSSRARLSRRRTKMDEAPRVNAAGPPHGIHLSIGDTSFLPCAIVTAVSRRGTACCVQARVERVIESAATVVKTGRDLRLKRATTTTAPALNDLSGRTLLRPRLIKICFFHVYHEHCIILARRSRLGNVLLLVVFVLELEFCFFFLAAASAGATSVVVLLFAVVLVVVTADTWK
jgi:hypothetical protein